ncbi:ABC transporter permease [Kribbella solani]|uniref:Peptide/nickel transport system permease protein n=1 Tax=Kribbella solani TaxID=236067 RepID=A0A841DQH5_9ACTN|nr:ABC transporter permease [Kribbella solani]MBB5980893.1 peptide/nickel transport system permease protein [Kribbella solani]
MILGRSPGEATRAFGSTPRIGIRIVRWRPSLSYAAIVMLVLVGASLTAGWWWNGSVYGTDPSAALHAPSLSHPMGTDTLGRDVMARVFAGARVSLGAGLVTAVAATVAGSLLGVLAGLRGGALDFVVCRVSDALMAFPPLILAVGVAAGLGAGLLPACFGIALGSMPYVLRICRADAIRVRGSGFVAAARALGVPPPQIVRRHVLPHVLPSILVQGAATCSFAVIALAGLGFIGLGAQLPTPEWGTMITEGSAPLVAGQWWISIFPGVLLLIATVCVNAMADEFQERLGGTREMAL